jgi:hypothetical protein
VVEDVGRGGRAWSWVRFVISEEVQCSICFEMVCRNNDCMTLPCGHCFHLPCLRDWCKKAPDSKDGAGCPNCRKTFLPKECCLNVEYNSLPSQVSVLDTDANLAAMVVMNDMLDAEQEEDQQPSSSWSGFFGSMFQGYMEMFGFRTVAGGVGGGAAVGAASGAPGGASARPDNEQRVLILHEPAGGMSLVLGVIHDDNEDCEITEVTHVSDPVASYDLTRRSPREDSPREDSPRASKRSRREDDV